MTEHLKELYEDSISNLISTLIDGYADNKFKVDDDQVEDGTPYITAETFSGASLGEFADRITDIWDGMLNTLQKEKENFGHYGLREHDFDNNNNSIGGYINTHADLSDDYLNNYWNVKTEETNNHWNESLSSLINYYKKYIDPNFRNEELIEFNDDGTVKDSHGLIKSDNKINYRIDDIINGDAGNYFGDDKTINGYGYKEANKKQSAPIKGNMDANKQQSELWVRPWFNGDGDTYSTVRNNDKIHRVLNSKKNLQFTRFKEKQSDYWNKIIKNVQEVDINNPEECEKYLRLIMPMYERIVEIEDLDRNFWVIGQILSSLSAYLFGDNSPIATMLTGLLDEIAQLWENVFYLWASMIEGLEETYENPQFIFAPIVDGVNIADTSKSFIYNGYDENKFDNFAKPYLSEEEMSAKDWLDLAKIKLEYYTEQYPNSALIIMPEIRRKNYAENYYAEVLYPGVLVYQRGLKSVSYKNRWKNCPFDTILKFDLTDNNIYNNLSNFDENWDEEIVTLNPDIMKNEEQVAIAALRTQLNIENIITNESNKGLIETATINMSFIDVGADSYKKIENKDIDSIYQRYTIKYEEGRCTKTYEQKDYKIPNFEKTQFQLLHFPFDRGEVASWVKFKVNIFVANANLFGNIVAHQLKLGSFMKSKSETGSIGQRRESPEEFRYLQVTRDNTFTDIRGNTTTRKTQDYSGGTGTIYYWKNEWDGYDPYEGTNKDILYDEIYHKSSAFPFKEMTPHYKEYLTKEQLYKDSCEAVKYFIEARKGKDFDETIPHYFITEVGLAPWRGSVQNQGYWNFSGLSHFLVYIPEILNDAFYTENSQKYEDIEPVIELEGVRGKIVSCFLINCFETFPSMTPYGGWRLIQALGVENGSALMETTQYQRRNLQISSSTKVALPEEYQLLIKYFNGNTDASYPKDGARIQGIYTFDKNGIVDVSNIKAGDKYKDDNEKRDHSREPLPYKDWINRLAMARTVGDLGYQEDENNNPLFNNKEGFYHYNGTQKIEGINYWGYNNPDYTFASNS